MKETARYIPPGSLPIPSAHGEVNGVVYAYSGLGPASKPFAIAYAGKQSKATWHHVFRDDARREAKTQEFYAGLATWEKAKQERRAERAKPHGIKPGAIVVNSWGYDQTNVDFYQVVRASEHFVWLARIGKTLTDDAGTAMSGYATPNITTLNTENTTKHKADGKGYVTMRFGCGSIWDGKPEYVSWDA